MYQRCRWLLLPGLAAALAVIGLVPSPADSACCYFSAKDKDVLQPAQKAFITWDPEEKVETFTVQPKFEGHAEDFGMVIPTPAKPKLDEMPRDFFKELAVFTILEPMDLSKYKQLRLSTRAVFATEYKAKDGAVKVLGGGIVGSMEYNILQYDPKAALHAW